MVTVKGRFQLSGRLGGHGQQGRIRGWCVHSVYQMPSAQCTSVFLASQQGGTFGLKPLKTQCCTELGSIRGRELPVPLKARLCGRVVVIMGTVGARRYSSSRSFEQFLKDLFD